VLVGHFINPNWLRFGPVGVELFFVLSGRLMAEILFVERFALQKFYVRRVARIFPALIVFSVGCFLLVYKTSLHYKPIGIIATDSMVYNYLTLAGHRVGVLDHIWSLCVEEHAYLLLGLIALAARRWRWPVATILAALAGASMADGVVSSLVFQQDWYTAYWRTDTHVASILAPAAIYLWSQPNGPLTVLRKFAGTSLLCALAGLALWTPGVPNAVAYTVGTTLLAISVCTLEDAWPWMRQCLSLKALTVAGVLSYSIYLWQQPFYKLAALAPPWATPLFFAGAILSGVASFYIVENPARRALNRLGERLLYRGASAADESAAPA
jgi:peptidoglycan/LPS O-acetylase OafA/YrhL